MNVWTGRTVEVTERNGYNDSDFLATYYDGSRFVTELCGTTRFAFPLSATVDAPAEVMALWNAEKERRCEAERLRRAQLDAANPTKGKRVEVTRGRKYIGAVGKVFWRGVNRFRTYYRNGYNDPEALKNQVIGIHTDEGTKIFVPADYVKVI